MELIISMISGILCSPPVIIMAMMIIYGMNGCGTRAKAAEA